ncbi:hypothetical protein LBMAG55_11800 [Verrucomicrobiota bacterium]|nr:hypothetical protein LBMAG55_11800 [Verrucomicrobiota bacterium]
MAIDPEQADAEDQGEGTDGPKGKAKGAGHGTCPQFGPLVLAGNKKPDGIASTGQVYSSLASP